MNTIGPETKTTERILITGGGGQIGTDLSEALAKKYGADNIFCSDVKFENTIRDGIHELQLNVLDESNFERILEDNKITTVYHLVSLLSGTSEKKPLLAKNLNLNPLLFLLEKAKAKKIERIFWPSSIAVFGKGIPKHNVSQDSVLHPESVYGITKLAGEELCRHYHDAYSVDVRSLRFPGLISWKAPAGGGTTDYAVEIFHHAIKNQLYKCFLTEYTALPMMYMDDAIEATLALMSADPNAISVRGSYNLGGVSFTPKEIANEIKKHFPDFTITYEPDFRQAIADSWPSSIDDTPAQKDWGLKLKYQLPDIVNDMILHLKKP